MGASPPIGSDYGDGCCGSYRLCYPHFRSAPSRPAQSTRGTGRTTGRIVFVLGVVIWSACPCDCVGVGDGGDCVSRMDVLDCLPAILRLPGNTSAVNAGRHRVGSRSGSIASPPTSYPLRFRILCPIAPPRCPRAAPCRPVSLLASSSSPHQSPHALSCQLSVKCLLRFPVPSLIIPCLSCRGSGADFIKASNSMRLKS